MYGIDNSILEEIASQPKDKTCIVCWKNGKKQEVTAKSQFGVGIKLLNMLAEMVDYIE